MNDCETLYFCPECGNEGWFDNLEVLPAEYACAYCGIDHFLVALTFEEVQEVLKSRKK